MNYSVWFNAKELASLRVTSRNDDNGEYQIYFGETISGVAAYLTADQVQTIAAAWEALAVDLRERDQADRGIPILKVSPSPDE